MNEEQIFANALNLIPELGPVRLARLKAGFGSFAGAWTAGYQDLLDIGFEAKLSEAIANKRVTIDPGLEADRLKTAGIRILMMDDPAYPAQLKEIPAPPPFLYIRGEAGVLSRLSVAVVGTRKMTLYGKQAACEITAGLVSAGLIVVSGLAFGIDAEAIRAALEAGGTCVAVLASPIDDPSISPRSNFQLAQDLLSRGCLASEYPLAAAVQKQNFPVRNRIISGLAAGTLVVEADEESGSLITARYALEQNRLVFAVPGSIFSPVSRGTNALLKAGAAPITSALDITRELNLDITAPIGDYEAAVEPEEQPLLELIGREPIAIDDLIRAAQVPASQVNALLAVLEMRGRVKNLGGGRYVRTR